MKQSSHVDLVFKLLGSAWCVKLWHPTHTHKFNDSDLDLIPSLSSNTPMKCIDFHKIRKYQLTLSFFFKYFSSMAIILCQTQHSTYTSYIHHHYINPTVFLSHLDFSKSVVEPRVCPFFWKNSIAMCPTGRHRHGDLGSTVVAQLVVTFSFLGWLSDSLLGIA